MFSIKPLTSTLFVISLTCTSLLHAQQSTNASGGSASGSGGSVSYTVGQVFYTSISDTSGKVSQGVQQTYEISNVGVKESNLNISLGVFPNPTVNNLTLSITDDYKNEKLTYQLIDLQGKLLSSGPITSPQTEINTSTLASATYFIHVMNQDNQKVQSFKIIKK
jgi:hypothetical protein